MNDTATLLNLARRLVGALAHELGTPLNVISGRAQLSSLMLQGGDAPAAAAHLDAISPQVDRIVGLLTDLQASLAHDERPLASDSLDDVAQALGLAASWEASLPSEVSCAATVVSTAHTLARSLPHADWLKVQVSDVHRPPEGLPKGQYVQVAAGSGDAADLPERAWRWRPSRGVERSSDLWLAVAEQSARDAQGWIASAEHVRVAYLPLSSLGDESTNAD